MRDTATQHSQKKGYQNSAPGVLLLQIAPFFSEGCFFSSVDGVPKQYS